MRILFIGYLGRGQTSGMRCAALGRLGHEVIAIDSGSIWNGAAYLLRHGEQMLHRGSRIERFNAAVVASASKYHPQLVWAEKQEYLLPDTLEQLRSLGTATLHYNPDPYFSLAWKRTALADACLRLYDVLVATKRYELQQYRAHARDQVIYSPLGYDPVGHAPAATMNDSEARDVVFIGGWEPRRERLLGTARLITPRVSIWGYGWRIAQGSRASPLRALRLGRLAPSQRLYFGAPATALAAAVEPGEGMNGEIYLERYAAAVTQSRISMGFVREICPDQHTTRTFEIPAMGGFMLADRTDEHLEFFEEGKEAEFFGSEDEFADKLAFYLSNNESRKQIARSGHYRCVNSGYSYDDRIRMIFNEIGM